MTIHALIEELISAWKTNDAHRASAFFAPDATYHESGHEPIVGREAIFAHFQRFFRDGPPWQFEVDEIVAEDERAAIAYRFAVKGSTGGWQERDGCAFVRREAGLIVYWREYHG